jgi:hypothetical protein
MGSSGWAASHCARIVRPDKTKTETFLADRAQGVPIEQLLAPPA